MRPVGLKKFPTAATGPCIRALKKTLPLSEPDVCEGAKNLSMKSRSRCRHCQPLMERNKNDCTQERIQSSAGSCRTEPDRCRLRTSCRRSKFRGKRVIGNQFERFRHVGLVGHVRIGYIGIVRLVRRRWLFRIVRYFRLVRRVRLVWFGFGRNRQHAINRASASYGRPHCTVSDRRRACSRVTMDGCGARAPEVPMHSDSVLRTAQRSRPAAPQAETAKFGYWGRTIAAPYRHPGTDTWVSGKIIPHSRRGVVSRPHTSDHADRGCDTCATRVKP